MLKTILALTTFAALSSVANASPSNEDCASIANRDKRLACYDRPTKSKTNLSPEISFEFIKQRTMNYSRCANNAWIATARYQSNGKITAADGCSGAASRQAEIDYPAVIENLAGNPEALRLLKEYYAAWGGVMASNNFGTPNNNNSARLNELCGRILLEIPSTEREKPTCIH